VFRAVRGATNGLPLDHKKLSRKFYQSFQKKEFGLNLQTPIYRRDHQKSKQG
jgi:hypothetical protein